MSELGLFPQYARHGRVRFLALIIIGLAIVGLAGVTGSSDAGPKDVTGTVTKAEPPIKQNGTPSHPFADANQCPSSTDLIIWPNGRSVPSIPPGISVCFVGNQSFNASAPGVQVRQR